MPAEHRFLPIAAAALLLTGCAAIGAPGSGQSPATSDTLAGADTKFEQRCEDPRPEICTKDYRPVCALRDNGVRCVTTPCDSTEEKTYGNGCMACSDPAVFGYDAGACRGAG